MPGDIDSLAHDADAHSLTTDPHSRQLEPFAFVHIPKTAGSILRLLIASLFDLSRVYPGFNLESYSGAEFRRQAASGDYGLFSGHMTLGGDRRHNRCNGPPAKCPYCPARTCFSFPLAAGICAQIGCQWGAILD